VRARPRDMLTSRMESCEGYRKIETGRKAYRMGKGNKTVDVNLSRGEGATLRLCRPCHEFPGPCFGQPTQPNRSALGTGPGDPPPFLAPRRLRKRWRTTPDYSPAPLRVQSMLPQVLPGGCGNRWRTLAPGGVLCPDWSLGLFGYRIQQVLDEPCPWQVVTRLVDVRGMPGRDRHHGLMALFFATARYQRRRCDGWWNGARGRGPSAVSLIFASAGQASRFPQYC